MARIKIEELPVIEDIDTQETKGIFGGGAVVEDKPAEFTPFSFNRSKTLVRRFSKAGGGPFASLAFRGTGRKAVNPLQIDNNDNLQ